jgi:hypothetical protein
LLFQQYAQLPIAAADFRILENQAQSVADGLLFSATARIAALPLNPMMLPSIDDSLRAESRGSAARIDKYQDTPTASMKERILLSKFESE